MPDTLTFYKIRRKGTMDQFSTGGATPKWSKMGKTWSRLGHIKSHLRQVQPDKRGGFSAQWRSRNQADYGEAEIVTFEAIPIAAESVDALLAQVEAKKVADRKRAQEQARQAKEDRERKQLRRLQSKYPNG